MSTITGVFPTFAAMHTNEVPKVRGGVDNTFETSSAFAPGEIAIIKGLIATISPKIVIRMPILPLIRYEHLSPFTDGADQVAATSYIVFLSQLYTARLEHLTWGSERDRALHVRAHARSRGRTAMAPAAALAADQRSAPPPQVRELRRAGPRGGRRAVGRAGLRSPSQHGVERERSTQCGQQSEASFQRANLGLGGALDSRRARRVLLRRSLLCDPSERVQHCLRRIYETNGDFPSSLVVSREF